jgi:hypothetical protein
MRATRFHRICAHSLRRSLLGGVHAWEDWLSLFCSTNGTWVRIVEGNPRVEERLVHCTAQINPLLMALPNRCNVKSFSFILQSSPKVEASLPYPNLGESSHSWDRLAWDEQGPSKGELFVTF